MQKIVHSIDWLQYSIAWPDFVWEWPFDEGEARDIIKACIPHLPVVGAAYSRPDGEQVFGMQGYRKAYDFGYASAHVEPQRRDMKIGVRMTGKDLGAWRDLGGKDERLIAFVAGAKATTSRVDVAFDVFNYGVDVSRLYADWKAGRLSARCRKVNPLTSAWKDEAGKVSEASTLYFGSRTSEMMVRVYEKGKEQNTDLDWVRFEIEAKGDKAVAVIQDMARLGVAAVGKQLLREYFPKMPYKFWTKLTEGQSEALTPVGRRITEREAWIRNVVLPVLAEEIEKEWSGEIETGITRDVEALIRQHWTVRAQAIKAQYGLI